MVYIRGFSCLDYSFDALILQIGNLGLYNWFYNIYFTCYLLTCSCIPVLTIRFSMHALDSDLSIHVCLSMLAIWHSSPHHSLGSSDSPGLACLDPEVRSLWILSNQICTEEA